MQCGAILLSPHFAETKGKVPVATRMNDVRFKRIVRPGETIRMEVDLVERLADAFFLKAKVSVAGQVAVRFEFACTLANMGDAQTTARQGAVMDFLQLSGKSILIFGLANRKSVAWHIGRVLAEAGARAFTLFGTRRFGRAAAKLLGASRKSSSAMSSIKEEIDRLAAIGRPRRKIPRPGAFHRLCRLFGRAKTLPRNAARGLLAGGRYLCFSLIALCNALKGLLDADASVVTISISTTRMASENYGYMAPIKAALDTSLAFLAKSFSQFSRVRFNAVAPGLLQDFGLGRHPGLCRVVPLRRAGHSAEKGDRDRRGGPRGGLSAQSAFQRRQRPADRGRRRHVDQLFRSPLGPPGGRVSGTLGATAGLSSSVAPRGGSTLLDKPAVAPGVSRPRYPH